jgi:hypothetical protein
MARSTALERAPRSPFALGSETLASLASEKSLSFRSLRTRSPMAFAVGSGWRRW